VPQTSSLSVRFWGVRGSIACPGPEYARYGGNTSCLEVRCGGELLIFDAGTGLRTLGGAIAGEAPIDADVFLTHTHIDHISGIPFCGPFFDKRNSFRLWAGHLAANGHNLHKVLCGFMAEPLFPVPPAIFKARMDFKDFVAGTTLHPHPRTTLRTAPLNHPNGATGYRIEHAGKSICYVTDTEHVPGRRDQTVLSLIEGADVLIYDSTYTDEEFPRFVNWGHSTWQEGVRLCEAAGVGRLAVFHHDPSHDDAFMDQVASAADRVRPGTVVAREGMVLDA
jgi:phosphoribosyl 1,2-cyclic phosphodiesterase